MRPHGGGGIWPNAEKADKGRGFGVLACADRRTYATAIGYIAVYSTW